MQSLTVATAQSTISQNVRSNGGHIRKLMAQAHEQGAKLVHFPEGALSGYAKSQIPNWNDVDWLAVRTELEAIAALAGRLTLWTVVGCNHRLTPPNRPHNSLYVISEHGEIAARYDKRYCSHAELSDWYTPGVAPCVFEVAGFRFGCALCIEIQFVEVFAEYERLDVDCVLFSAYADDPMFWNQAQGYAATNNLWISVSTPAPCSTGLASGLIGPNGTPLARATNAGQPHMLIQTLDRQDPAFDIALNKARPWRRTARTGQIYREKHVHDPRSEDQQSLP